MAKLLIWLKRLWHSVYRPDKVMYIGGSDTLPPPLPRDEESVLLEKLNTGDFQVRQTLIEHNLRLVVYPAGSGSGCWGCRQPLLWPAASTRGRW